MTCLVTDPRLGHHSTNQGWNKKEQKDEEPEQILNTGSYIRHTLTLHFIKSSSSYREKKIILESVRPIIFMEIEMEQKKYSVLYSRPGLICGDQALVNPSLSSHDLSTK